jgi:hypothetical protein
VSNETSVNVTTFMLTASGDVTGAGVLTPTGGSLSFGAAVR